MTRIVRAGSLVLALALLGVAGCTPATPSVQLSSTTLSMADSGAVTPVLSCSGTTTCTGTVQLRVGSAEGTARAYSVAGGATQGVELVLTQAQLDGVPAGSNTGAQVRIDEAGPKDIAAKDGAVTIARPAGPLTSKAYRERNWTPTAHDTCSAAFHRSFSVIGPDGRLYPGWHPPTAIDPASGKRCSFGHEHGDDPASSDIYAWVTDFLDAQPQQGRGIPFGYVSEALDTYGTGVTRHEDNVGHKIVVANNVKLVTANPRGYLRDSKGAVVTCDFLLKVHQGSHSGDALINNAHELLYAARCTDGTEIISSTLSRFGDANEFNRSCTSALVQTAGSDLPDGDGGSRLIPDQFCIDRDVLVPPSQASSIWALYEVWRSANAITKADGTSLASFDPWFGVRNPSRAHAGGVNNAICNLVDVSDMTDPVDGGTSRGYPFDEVAEIEGETGAELAKNDPASPFDGAQRDYYLHATTIANAGGTTTWFTDPWGGHAVTSASPGLVRQHLSSTANATWPDLERRSFNLERDYGDANGVHAPN